MTIHFEWDWDAGPSSIMPELAATWCRLRIDVDETPATLVERRDKAGTPRHGLDVSSYPLAEHLAINWWKLSATAHPASAAGVRFVDAGGGFPWPDLTLRNDQGLIWFSLRRRDEDPEQVRFMTQVETVSDANEVLASIADFIDATVRRLEDSGVTDSFLQNEWSAIQAADREEREFCLVAAAWGQDPYDIPAEVGDALIAAGVELGSVDLLADLARAVPLARMGESTNWLKEAVSELQVQNFRVPHFGRRRGLASFSLAPWHLGWEAAQQVRAGLSYPVGEAMPVLDLVQVQQTDSASPGNIDALLQVDGAERLGVVVGSNSTLTAKRFTAARAIGRRSLVTAPRMSLLTRSTGYTERAERAFAAEFLAPAEGVRAVLGGDFSDAAIRQAADRFGVSSALVQHQIDNQLAA